ncbi:hypothetical protein OG417_53020 [Actinoallomurus sp. NBC_01490]|uniref:hypothetical protein n=1 Tax=Actinoallomurus sp. NBC_01490 TaxID=2903557 RepID=UPI002E377D9C|nr:hypothetical protein [Actinoallomurus sp. NBC_01490]
MLDGLTGVRSGHPYARRRAQRERSVVDVRARLRASLLGECFAVGERSGVGERVGSDERLRLGERVGSDERLRLGERVGLGGRAGLGGGLVVARAERVGGGLLLLRPGRRDVLGGHQHAPLVEPVVAEQVLRPVQPHLVVQAVALAERVERPAPALQDGGGRRLEREVGRQVGGEAPHALVPHPRTAVQVLRLPRAEAEDAVVGVEHALHQAGPCPCELVLGQRPVLALPARGLLREDLPGLAGHALAGRLHGEPDVQPVGPGGVVVPRAPLLEPDPQALVLLTGEQRAETVVDRAAEGGLHRRQGPLGRRDAVLEAEPVAELLAQPRIVLPRGAPGRQVLEGALDRGLARGLRREPGRQGPDRLVERLPPPRHGLLGDRLAGREVPVVTGPKLLLTVVQHLPAARLGGRGIPCREPVQEGAVGVGQVILERRGLRLEQLGEAFLLRRQAGPPVEGVPQAVGQLAQPGGDLATAHRQVLVDVGGLLEDVPYGVLPPPVELHSLLLVHDLGDRLGRLERQAALGRAEPAPPECEPPVEGLPAVADRDLPGGLQVQLAGERVDDLLPVPVACEQPAFELLPQTFLDLLEPGVVPRLRVVAHPGPYGLLERRPLLGRHGDLREPGQLLVVLGEHLLVPVEHPGLRRPQRVCAPVAGRGLRRREDELTALPLGLAEGGVGELLLDVRAADLLDPPARPRDRLAGAHRRLPGLPGGGQAGELLPGLLPAVRDVVQGGEPAGVVRLQPGAQFRVERPVTCEVHRLPGERGPLGPVPGLDLR